MAINFPLSPSVNDLYTFNNQTWIWDGTGWALRQSPSTLPIVGTRVGTATASTSTTAINVSGFDTIIITMTSSTTLTLSGAQDGARIVLKFVQDATGGRVLTLGSSFRLGTDITSVTLSTAANKTDMLGVIYNSAAAKYDVAALVKGF